MNKFVLSALALTTAGGLASAGTGSEEWLTLDREIASLAGAQAASQAPASGVSVSGFIRSSFQYSSDVEVPVGEEDETNDLSGFVLDNARVNITGTIGDYMLYVQMDAVTDPWQELWSGDYSPPDGLLNTTLGAALGLQPEVGSVGVLDAYGAWNISDQFRLTMGQFRSPFLASAQRDENHLLFMDRTVAANIWAHRDLGVMLSGDYDMLSWGIAAQNGVDGVGDDLAFSGRVTFHAMGAGQKLEGAYGAPEGTNLGFSAGYYTDGDSIVDDLSAWNIEGSLIVGPFSAEASYVDHDDGFSGLLGDDAPSILAVTGGFMFVPERWELAARWEDLDDENSTTVLTFGVNYYAMGHDAKWMLNYAILDSDEDSLDADILGIGLTVGV